MNTIEKIQWMQARANSLSIEINEHRSCYRTVREDLELFDRSGDFPSPDVMQKCIEADQLVKVQCYVHTPVGFLVVLHHDLAVAVDIMFGWVEPELRNKEH